MRFNLLQERWLPVIRADGSRESVAPWEIVGDGSPPLDLVPPRADFRAALLEFLIGLMQTALAPAREKDWKRLLRQPPTPDALQQALAPHEPFFNLFGDKPLFMQDFELRPPERAAGCNDVAALLIDSPGGQTLRNNGDFFVKRGGVTVLCPACAAMALYTLQAFAPSGGKGHRTSLRGGGPLSTLVDGGTVWEKVWRNVLPLSTTYAGLGRSPSPEALSGGVYTWAAPTRESSQGLQTHPGDVHPMQAYWGMPRRILLLPEDSDGTEPCSLCAARAPRMVRRYFTRPYGTNYGDTWRHPLTPYRLQGQDRPSLSVKGTASIAGYGHWLGVVYGQGSDEKGVRRAACVDSALPLLAEDGVAPEVAVAGFDMDNMKALQWCESRFPYYHVDSSRMPEFRSVVGMLIEAADAVRRNLVGLLKEALVNEAGRNQAKVDKTLFENAGTALWGRTEAEFYRLAREAASEPGLDATQSLRSAWATLLVRSARELFEEHTLRGRVKPERMLRIVEAGRKLDNFNRKKLRGVLLLPETGGTT